MCALCRHRQHAQKLRICLVVAVTAGAFASAAAQESAVVAPPAVAPLQRFIDSADAQDNAKAEWTLRTPPTLRRVVQRFTFEEAELRPLDMPLFFYRYEAADHGFPSFGTMGPRNDHAKAGNWSFGFELNGGSMAARVPTGIIPIVDSGTYVITTHVRTDGLVHSRAQLVAWLHDSEGNPITSTRTSSEPIDTHGQWEALTVKVNAEGVQAADLAVELRLVQPREYLSDPRLAPPDAEDITGRAWFDEIVIWHAPLLELTTGRPGNVIAPNESPAVEFELRDVASEALAALLRVYDIDGNLVHQQQFDHHYELSERRTIALPELPAGWYRAVFDAHSNTQIVGRAWLDFAKLGPLRRGEVGRTKHRFGVELAKEARRDLRDAAALLDRMGADTIVVPIWPEGGDDSTGATTKALVSVAEAMLNLNRDVVVALDEIPAELATQLGINRTHVLQIIAGDSDIWRPYLDEPILALGLEVRRWRINVSPDQYSSEQEFGKQLLLATRSLSEFVPDPEFTIPWSVFQEPSSLTWPAYEVRVPAALRPEDVESAIAPWVDSTERSSARLSSADGLDYAPRQLVDDMSRRVLFAWRGGVRELIIDAPWRMNDILAGRSLPTPMLPAWRVLADQLTGRSYVGELDLPDIEACWIMQGDTTADAAIVAWTGSMTGDTRAIDMLLADGPVTVIDLFGNARIVEPVNNRHHIEIGETPLFIEGIDAQLAQFRAMFTVEPAAIPSMHRLHEIELVLRNPWDISVNGTLRVRTSDEWTLNPRTNPFTIEPRGEVRLPVEVIFGRNVVSGKKVLEADLSLRSDRLYEIGITTTFELGVSRLHVSAQWQVQRNPVTGVDDLIITEYVINRGTQAMTVSAFLYAPKLVPRLRPLGHLEPGASAVHRFHIEDGARLLSGATVRYGVKEMDGSTRLNRVLTIPSFQADNLAEARPE